ncbi:SMI1/KNR4 family protein [Candidatus Uabimicrobium sp. HlEnr_7]|uniref:SMI1/KNR4 family protein n=1 Tax=Candidatus Uabimicrobium helgolandensis TaxID=3095367 RepID=UPI00355883F1
METIKEKLLLLKKCDTDFEIFGSWEHRYELNEPLPVKDFRAIEKKYDCTFPEDYRIFITEIGNGGAGPGLGLFPVGKQDGDFREGELIDCWERGRLIGDLSKLFQHTKGVDAIDDFWRNLEKKLNIKIEELPEEENKALYRKYRKDLFAYVDSVYDPRDLMQGAIPICHIGCAKRLWLVINGPQNGNVWLDLRCNDIGIFPYLNNVEEPMTFYDWYLYWLVESLAEIESMQK